MLLWWCKFFFFFFHLALNEGNLDLIIRLSIAKTSAVLISEAWQKEIIAE